MVWITECRDRKFGKLRSTIDQPFKIFRGDLIIHDILETFVLFQIHGKLFHGLHSDFQKARAQAHAGYADFAERLKIRYAGKCNYIHRTT